MIAYTLLVVVLPLVLAIPSPALPSAKDEQLVKRGVFRQFSLYNIPLVRAAPTAAITSSDEVENDYGDPLAGYGEGGPRATEAEIPKTSDAFLVAAPPAVQFNVPPRDAKSDDVVGVAPKFTGSFRVPLMERVNAFDVPKSRQEAITNPAAYFMEGADLSNVARPKCQMVGCDGPVVNDEDLNLVENARLGGANQLCHQTFVPLNGCVDGKGYPVGMMCTICCDCTAAFKLEMVKSRGFKDGFRADQH